MDAATCPPSAGPADFDEFTPPPRQPIPRCLDLPTGESVLGAFRQWDYEQRVPAGCVLADFVGTGADFTSTVSGYRVAASSERAGPLGRAALGMAGEAIPSAKLAGWSTIAHIGERNPRRVTLVVLAPPLNPHAESNHHGRGHHHNGSG